MHRGIYNNLTLSIILGQLHTWSVLISNNLCPLQAVLFFLSSVKSISITIQELQEKKNQVSTVTHLSPSPQHSLCSPDIQFISKVWPFLLTFTTTTVDQVIVLSLSGLPEWSPHWSPWVHTDTFPIHSPRSSQGVVSKLQVRPCYPLSTHLKPSHGSLWH